MTSQFWLGACWPEKAALIIQNRLNLAVSSGVRRSVMLTGGRSAEQLYSAWALLPDFGTLMDVDFYFGDERCVLPTDADSNFGLVMRTLFMNGLPNSCAVHRMEAEGTNMIAAAESYAKRLPQAIDILLLGVGEDGHVASLFPHGEALGEMSHRVVPVIGPKPPLRRLTVTPPVIRSAREVFVLAPGDKSALYEVAQRDPADVDTLPARLVLGATWLLGDEQNSVNFDKRDWHA